jgi:hypothetical protein
MKPEIESLNRNRTVGLHGAIESFEMFDPLGNTSAAALVQTGAPDSFELWLWDFNSSVPRRKVASLGLLKNAMDIFYHAKLKEGFIEPLAGENNHRHS